MNTNTTNMAPKRSKAFRLVFAICSLAAFALNGESIYVAVEDANAGDDAVEGRGTEALPYKTLQAAMGHATLKADETVWVKRGTYDKGGATYGDSNTTSNRVVVKLGVRLVSVDGAAATVIKGAPGVRCVYLNQYARLTGFTLANGQTTVDSDGYNGSGGGICGKGASYSLGWDSTEAIVADCIFTNCYAKARGGANYGKSLFVRCRFIDCEAGSSIGAISSGGAAQFYNCLFRQKSTTGTYSLYQAGETVNCTFVGGGASLRNCGSSYNSVFLQRLGPVSANTYLNADVKFYNCHICCSADYFPVPERCENCTMSVPEDVSAPHRGYRLFGNFAPMRETSAYRACTDYAAYQALFPSSWQYNMAPYDLYKQPRRAAGATAFNAGCVETDETRWYVDATNGSDDYAGDDKGSAEHPYRTLQAAMENPALSSGQVVVAMPGVYNAGGVPYADGSVTNRVSVPDDVTLESAAGNAVTVIEGAPASAGAYGSEGLGDGAVRAVKLGVNSILRGFTVRSGYTKADGGETYYGGGICGDVKDVSIMPLVFDCRISDCFAMRGGAAMKIMANRCRFADCGASEYAVAYQSHLYNCVFGGQKSGTYAAMYCDKVRNCSFVSSEGVAVGTYYAADMGVNSNRVVNCVFCCAAQANANYTSCAFATNNNMNANLTADGMGRRSFKGDLEDFKVAADGSLRSGSSLADCGDSSLYPFADRGWKDVFGVPRVLNRVIDIGASEYDWRVDFAAALGGNRGFSVDNVSSNVVLNAGGGVKIDGDGFMSVSWTNRAAIAKLQQFSFMSATTDGVLQCSRNGSAAQTVPDGEQRFRSTERLMRLDFDFAGNGCAVLSSFERKIGMIISFY